MSRRANPYSSSSLNHTGVLQRQYSMKSEHPNRPDRSTSPYKSHPQPDPDTTRLRETSQLSPRYLSVTDHSFSGRSSMIAVSRVSQHPSFESYDSSMSANSWASSNEPDLTGHPASPSIAPTGAHTGVTPRHTDKSVELVTMRRVDSGFTDRSGPNRDGMGMSDPDLATGHRSREEVTGAAGMRMASRKFDKTDGVGKINLKIIGSEKDRSSEEKSSGTSAGSGPQFKGLWKRAFQSMKKDKGKRDKSLPERKDPEVQLGEVDPIYHLLRCAANKNQSTAAATSGITTSRTGNLQRMNTMDAPLANILASTLQITGTDRALRNASIIGSAGATASAAAAAAAARKKSPAVTFKPLQSSNPLLMMPDNLISTDTLTGVLPNTQSPISRSPQSSADRQSETSRIDSHLTVDGEPAVSSEALLAYEQHKRTVARRGMLKYTQKSLSFALGDDECKEGGYSPVARTEQPVGVPPGMQSEWRPPEIGSNPGTRKRVPLSHRLKSVSVDEQVDYLDQPREPWSSISPKNHSPRGTGSKVSISSISPRVQHIAQFDHYPQPSPESHRTLRIPLSSTKSFSLDVPGADKPNPAIIGQSGSSSPGHPSVEPDMHGSMRPGHPSVSRKSALSWSPHSTVRFVNNTSPYGGRSPNRFEQVPSELHRSTQFPTPDWTAGGGTLAEQIRRSPCQTHSSEFNIGMHRTPLNSRAPPHLQPRLDVYPNQPPVASPSRREVEASSNLRHVIRDYLPRRPDELLLRTGQYVRVLDDQDAVWWYGKSHGQAGYFPSACVQRSDRE